MLSISEVFVTSAEVANSLVSSSLLKDSAVLEGTSELGASLLSLVDDTTLVESVVLEDSSELVVSRIDSSVLEGSILEDSVLEGSSVLEDSVLEGPVLEDSSVLEDCVDIPSVLEALPDNGTSLVGIIELAGSSVLESSMEVSISLVREVVFEISVENPVSGLVFVEIEMSGLSSLWPPQSKQRSQRLKLR